MRANAGRSKRTSRVGMVLALALTGLLTSCSAPAAASSLEQLARASIDAMKSGDFAELRPYLLTRDDLRWIVAKLQGGKSRQTQRLLALFENKGAEGMLAEYEQRLRRSFDALRKEAADEGVDWQQLEFDRVHKPQTRVIDGLEAGRCYIRLRIGDKKGEIRLDSAFRTPRGWVFAEGWRS